jgi:LmbE family N-acetylglucosaminyl deacetylase
MDLDDFERREDESRRSTLHGTPGPHAPENRSIRGVGTSESLWSHWAASRELAGCDADDWAGRFARIWVVSPHPDDEVLALGATLARLAQLGIPLHIVSVTDGEASEPSSRRLGPERLARTRRDELREALDRLGIGGRIERLGLADGRIARDRNALLRALVDRVDQHDLVLAPCRFDGPPDYETCGETMDFVGQLSGARVFEYPVWMWHWASPDDRLVPWQRARRLPVSREHLARKRDALFAFRSQIAPDDQGRAALPEAVVARFLRTYETVFV